MAGEKTDDSRLRIIMVRFRAPYRSEIETIRHRVFSEEQRIDPRIDFDGLDTEAVHVLIQAAGQYVATGRMLPDGHIGRLAVLKPWRGQGLGRKIIETLIAAASRAGIGTVFLAAQQPAVGFYERLGFYPLGEPFREVGIMHLNMAKNIQGAAT